MFVASTVLPIAVNENDELTATRKGGRLALIERRVWTYLERGELSPQQQESLCGMLESPGIGEQSGLGQAADAGGNA